MHRHDLKLAALFVMLLISFSGSLFAQGEIAVRRLTVPAADVADGATDSVIDIERGVYTGIVYRISNSGSATLNLTSAISFSNFSNCSASIPAQPTGAIAAGSSDSFLIWIYSTQEGAFSFNVTVPNSDSNENPFDYTITGNIVAPAGTAQAPAGTTMGDGGGGGACVAVRGQTAASVFFLAAITALAAARRRSSRA